AGAPSDQLTHQAAGRELQWTEVVRGLFVDQFLERRKAGKLRHGKPFSFLLRSGLQGNGATLGNAKESRGLRIEVIFLRGGIQHLGGQGDFTITEGGVNMRILAMPRQIRDQAPETCRAESLSDGQ